MEQVTDTATDSGEQPQNKVYAATLEKTRKAMNTLLNRFLENPKADTQRYRAAIYTLKSIAETHKMEREFEIEQRLAALEKRMEHHDEVSQSN